MKISALNFMRLIVDAEAGLKTYNEITRTTMTKVIEDCKNFARSMTDEVDAVHIQPYKLRPVLIQQVQLTLSTEDLMLLYRANVVLYFKQLYPGRERYEGTKDFDNKVEDYCNSQFKHVLRYLRGESMGAEVSDLTAAFATNYYMRVVA